MEVEGERLLIPTVDLINIHQYEYFTTSSRKALSPPKGNTGRADRARESKPLTCWRLNK